MEYLDIVDEFGVPTGDIIDRETAHLEGIRHRTSHVWLVREKNGALQVLLQKRAKDKDSFPGCYDISSAGHIPAGDDFKPSALRELKEELGVTAEEKDLVVCGDRTICLDEQFRGKPFHDRQVSRVFYMWLDLEEDQFSLQPEELECVCWMELEKCISGVEDNSFPHCIALEELLMLRNSLNI